MERNRQFLFLSLAIDTVVAISADPLTDFLVGAFSKPALLNGVWPALALAGYLYVLYLVPKLPHQEGSQPAENGAPTTRTRWVARSIMLGTLTFLVAVPWVMGDALHTVQEWAQNGGGGVLGLVASVPMLVLIFLPFYLFLRPGVQPAPARHVPVLSAVVLLVTDLVALVGAALWQWQLRGLPALQGDPSPAAYAGMLVVAPIFLFVYGGPRIVLLNRNFSWLGAAGLFLSTAWYLVHDFVL